MPGITQQCSNQWHRFTTSCQQNYAALQQGINDGIQTLHQNPKATLKVGCYAIGALAAIGTIALIGSSIGSFAIGAVAAGTITVCVGIFVAIIAHDAFKIGKNVDLLKLEELSTSFEGFKAIGSTAKRTLFGMDDSGENTTINILLQGTFFKNIPGSRGFLGPIVEEFLK